MSHSSAAHRRYLIVVTTGLLLALAAAAALNVAADPFGVYRGAERSDLSPEARTSRIAVGERLRQAAAHTLLVGSSRVGALDPASPHLAGVTTQNLTMPGASMEELAAVVDYACRSNRPRRIVLCVDFFQFSAARSPAPEFERSRLSPKFCWFEYHCDKLFGRNALKQSWRAVREGRLAFAASPAIAGAVPVVGPRAVRTIRSPPPEPGPIEPGARRRSFEFDLGNYLSPNGFYGGFRRSPARDEEFRRAAAGALEHGVELIVVALPVHAVDLEAVRAAGHWEALEDWKRTLPRICRDEAARTGRIVPAVWDFTGYSLQRGEPVPEADSTRDMRWYVNGSHFNNYLGELVLERILRASDVDDALAVRLDRVDVERHLASIRRDRTVWATANAAEAENVRRIASRVGRSRPDDEPLTVAAKSDPLRR